MEWFVRVAILFTRVGSSVGRRVACREESVDANIDLYRQPFDGMPPIPDLGEAAETGFIRQQTVDKLVFAVKHYTLLL